jgi:hypothetical protein
MFALCLGCASPPPPIEPGEPIEPGDAAPASPSPACEAQRAAVIEQQCGDEDDCEVVELACFHELDFDGDGVADRVELTQENGALALRVHFGAGPEQVVGATDTPLAEYLGPDEAPEPSEAPEQRTLPPDWTWIAAWSPAPRENHELVTGRMRFDAGAARGDGLWLSGSDAAAMLVLTDDGWLVLELGY